MAVVKHMGVEYPCSKAVKGADFVHLLNEKGKVTIAFDGVSDFSGFSITGGSWIAALEEDDYVAIMKDDGTVGKGSHRCCDLIAAEVCETEPTVLEEGKWYLIKEV